MKEKRELATQISSRQTFPEEEIARAGDLRWSVLSAVEAEKGRSGKVGEIIGEQIAKDFGGHSEKVDSEEHCTRSEMGRDTI